MGLLKSDPLDEEGCICTTITTAKKRRLRRKKLQQARNLKVEQNNIQELKMLNNEPEKSRDEIKAAREAKKLAKQKAKVKDSIITSTKENVNSSTKPSGSKPKTETSVNTEENKHEDLKIISESAKSKDEVDRAAVVTENIATNTEKSIETIKSERAAKKAAKQAKKKSNNDHKLVDEKSKNDGLVNDMVKSGENKPDNDKPVNDLTVKEVYDTLKDIVNVAKDVQAVTNKVIAIDLGHRKTKDEPTKSKAELKAERRAKQEAQRAAKESAQTTKQKAESKVETNKSPSVPKEEKSKPKSVEKSKSKSQSMQKMNWFQHLHTEHDKQSLKQMAININLHPAVKKLGVQLANHVVTGSNARCIALLDALKKMIRDYTLPARTELSRGLEAAVADSASFLWAMRPPSAAQVNALKHLRHHITQLPSDVDEFDAKKCLQEEIDRYIHEQIEMAGEAISIAVRKKICDGDNILTYGCSSLVERILVSAHGAGVRFRAVVVGARVGGGAAELLRRLRAAGVCALYADISALSALMRHMNKVIVGCASLLINGAVLAPAGTLSAALSARAHNVPLLVACETHKFADNVQTDAFVYNEIGDPDDLIDKTDDNSPLKDWKSNPNLSLLNLTYDVTPPSLVTAVVTELAVLPCTSAPVVVRYKMSEYAL